MQNRGLGYNHKTVKRNVKLKDRKFRGIQIILAIRNLTGSPFKKMRDSYLISYISLYTFDKNTSHQNDKFKLVHSGKWNASPPPPVSLVTMQMSPKCKHPQADLAKV